MAVVGKCSCIRSDEPCPEVMLALVPTLVSYTAENHPGLHWNLMKRVGEVRERRLRIQALPEVNRAVQIQCGPICYLSSTMKVEKFLPCVEETLVMDAPK